MEIRCTIGPIIYQSVADVKGSHVWCETMVITICVVPRAVVDDLRLSVCPFQYDELVVEQIVVPLQVQPEMTAQPVRREIDRPGSRHVRIQVSHAEMPTWNKARARARTWLIRSFFVRFG